jgi:hypothetical protein
LRVIGIFSIEASGGRPFGVVLLERRREDGWLMGGNGFDIVDEKRKCEPNQTALFKS